MYTKLDEQFNQIPSLAWLPWVGDNYFSIPQENRMLIVGESHYGDRGLEESKKFFEDRTITRGLHEEIAIDGISYGTKIFPNLYRTLFPNESINKEKRETFWQLASYYNFIQRPMIKDLARADGYVERPTSSDFRSGWHTFFAVYKLLKPQICLFIGTTSADKFNDEIGKEAELKADKIQWHSEEINRAYPKFTKLYFNGLESNLFFIRHTSSRYSSDKWNDYLNGKICNQLQWLENQLK